jgi:MFS family permease
LRASHIAALAALYMSIYSLVGIVVSRPIGRWLERAGMGRALIWASALFAIGCLMALWRPGTGAVFLFARGLEGLAFAICAIAGPIVAARSARRQDLPLVTGLIAGWVPLGQIIAGVATALLPDWRFPWLLGLGRLGSASRPCIAGYHRAPPARERWHGIQVHKRRLHDGREVGMIMVKDYNA